MSRLARVLLLGCALLLVSCEAATETEEAEEERPLPAAHSEDTVELTIYLRTGSSEEAMLQPVSRAVPIEGNLAHRAVELLLAGASGDEELETPWPNGTELLGVTVDEGVATVDLSDDALEGEPEGGGSGRLEALALAALANTLTEFPTIDEVQVTVDGQSPESSEAVTAFWGGWGLPASLTRDETLIGEDGGGRFLALGDFSTDAQVVGSDDAEGVHVRSVRLRDRITYVRVVVELADADEPDASPDDIPRAYARGAPDEFVLEVTGIESMDEDGIRSELDARLEKFLSGLAVGSGQRGSDSVRITLTPAEEDLRDFHLHTRDGPSRIVLDIKK